MKAGDFVKGISTNYSITDKKMKKAVVLSVDDDSMDIKILQHESGTTGKFHVDQKYFEVIGEVKAFDREELLKRMADGEKEAIFDYDLRGANLRGANLRGADLDFSCIPLWCGSLLANMDDRQAKQLLYHTLSIVKNSDNVSQEIKDKLLTEANIEVAKEFHRSSECNKL